MPHIHTLLHPLPFHHARHVSTRKRIPRAIRIANLLLRHFPNPKLSHRLLPLCRNKRLLRPLRNHHRPLPPSILLPAIRNRARNCLHVLGVGQRMRGGVRLGLSLVADDEVGVGQHLVERVFEELRDEGRREVDGERLVLPRRFLAQRQDRGHSDGQVEAADVVEARLRGVAPDLRRL